MDAKLVVDRFEHDLVRRAAVGAKRRAPPQERERRRLRDFVDVAQEGDVAVGGDAEEEPEEPRALVCLDAAHREPIVAESAADKGILGSLRLWLLGNKRDTASKSSEQVKDVQARLNAVEEQVQDLGKVAATLAELAAKMQAQAPSAA